MNFEAFIPILEKADINLHMKLKDGKITILTVLHKQDGDAFDVIPLRVIGTAEELNNPAEGFTAAIERTFTQNLGFIANIDEVVESMKSAAAKPAPAATTDSKSTGGSKPTPTPEPTFETVTIPRNNKEELKAHHAIKTALEQAEKRGKDDEDMINFYQKQAMAEAEKVKSIKNYSKMVQDRFKALRELLAAAKNTAVVTEETDDSTKDDATTDEATLNKSEGHGSFPGADQDSDDVANPVIEQKPAESPVVEEKKELTPAQKAAATRKANAEKANAEKTKLEATNPQPTQVPQEIANLASKPGEVGEIIVAGVGTTVQTQEIDAEDPFADGQDPEEDTLTETQLDAVTEKTAPEVVTPPQDSAPDEDEIDIF